MHNVAKKQHILALFLGLFCGFLLFTVLEAIIYLIKTILFSSRNLKGPSYAAIFELVSNDLITFTFKAPLLVRYPTALERFELQLLKEIFDAVPTTSKLALIGLSPAL